MQNHGSRFVIGGSLHAHVDEDADVVLVGLTTCRNVTNPRYRTWIFSMRYSETERLTGRGELLKNEDRANVAPP